MSTRKKRSNKERDLVVEAFLNMLEEEPYVPEKEISVQRELDLLRDK